MKFLRRQKPLPLFLLFLIILTIGEGGRYGACFVLSQTAIWVRNLSNDDSGYGSVFSLPDFGGTDAAIPEICVQSFFCSRYSVFDRCCLGKCASSGILKSNCESNIGFDRYSIF